MPAAASWLESPFDENQPGGVEAQAQASLAS